jgi:heat-inducible transcriptional repressor
MADLEEMGLILQPHTSAGRIPSDQGYRVYVDEMLREKEQEVENMKEMLLDKEEKLENLLKQVAKTLAIDTNYATMISAPQIRKNKLKFIQISKVDDEHLLATIVIEGNVIKNKIIPVEEVLDDATMLKLNILMNTRLDGLAVEDINLGLIAAVKQEAGIHSEIIGNVIDAAAESITADEDLQIYTSGTMNIFKYPELTDNAKASELISTFEDTKDLSSIVEGTLANEAEETGIQVYIGNETPVQAMKDCSVVTATYELGDGMKGTVGIIGPKRMDYDKVITTLKNMRHALDDLYKKS